MRPAVFIGSSSEGKDVAQKIRIQLCDCAEVVIWNEGPFGLGEGTLESLVEALNKFDYAILVLTPDDMVRSRGRASQSPRDNVLFECGLFMGHLGRHRTFIVYDRDKKIKIPSDFAGVTEATYRGNRDDHNLLAAIGEACDLIRDAINMRGPLPTRRVGGVPIGLHSFRDVFGEDIINASFYLVYAEFALRDAMEADGSPARFAFIKPGNIRSEFAFSVQRPISSCEVRAIKYLTEAISKETSMAPILSSDLELTDRLDISFAAFGGGSNYKTNDVLTNSGNDLITLSDYGFVTVLSRKSILNLTRGFDYGLILKIHPSQFNNRCWFTCAGIGEWGTSGAAWYLAKKWRDIYDFAGNSPFAIIVRVRRGQDESAEPEIKIKSAAQAERLTDRYSG